jgi:hypothetical protein
MDTAPGSNATGCARPPTTPTNEGITLVGTPLAPSLAGGGSRWRDHRCDGRESRPTIATALSDDAIDWDAGG